MNDKETYGIELELITNKFKSKLNEIKNKVNELRNMKDYFKIEPLKAGDDLETQIKKMAKDIQAFLRENKIHVKYDLDPESPTSAMSGYTILDSLKYKNLVPEDAKNRITELVETMQTFYEISKSGNQEVIDGFKLDSEGAKELNSDLRELHRTLKEMPSFTDKVKDSFSRLKEIVISIKKPLNNLFDKFKKDTSGSKGIGSSIANAFSKGIASIKRFSIALLGVRGIYGLLRKAVSQYLEEHDTVKRQMEAMFSGLGNLLAPAIEYVINLFSKLLAYINEFIKMLTGVDLFAKGMANASKSAKSTANSVNKIKGGLAGIDEITNIANNEGGAGAGGSGGDVSLLPKVDLEPLKKLKDFLSKLFEPFQKAWDKTKTNFIKSFTNMVKGLKDMFGSIGSSLWEVWTNGTAQGILEEIIGMWGDVFDIIGNVGKAISNAWDKNKNGTRLIQAIADIYKSILGFVRSIGDTVKKWTASQGFQDALDRIFTFVSDIFGYIKDISEWILGMYNKYIKPVIDDALLPAISSIITAIGDIWNAVKPVVDKIVNIIKNILEPVIKTLIGIIQTIINVIKNIATFISGVFTGDWKKAWTGLKNIFVDIWNGIKKFFSNIMETIKTIFVNVWNGIKNAFSSIITKIIKAMEKALNTIVDGANAVIKKLKNSGLGLGTTGIFKKNTSQALSGVTLGTSAINKILGTVGINGYATGTPYIENDGLAYLHQGEAVIPEKFNDRKYFGNDEETKDLLRELIDTVENKDTNTYIDGKAIGKTATEYINTQKRLLGRSVI